jgi:hypothetical protein
MRRDCHRACRLRSDDLAERSGRSGHLEVSGGLAVEQAELAGLRSSDGNDADVGGRAGLDLVGGFVGAGDSERAGGNSAVGVTGRRRLVDHVGHVRLTLADEWHGPTGSNRLRGWRPRCRGDGRRPAGGVGRDADTAAHIVDHVCVNLPRRS